MARRSDTSASHFEWLTENRSRNQRSSVALYGLIERHPKALIERAPYQLIAQELAAVSFSLWRAVFLIDLSGDLGEQLGDVTAFLRNLIAHNTVLYQTDYNSREWAFIYYLENATRRLDAIADLRPSLIAKNAFDATSFSAKDAWTRAQAALDLAIANFAKVLAAHDPS